MKIFRLALLGAAAAAAIAFAGVGLPERAVSAGATRSITVTGTGTVSAVPDRSTFTFGVSARGATAAETLSTDSTRMQKLIDALKAAAIPSTSIQTSSVSLSPRTTDDGRTVVGYDASNSVTVVTEIGRAGAVVDAAVAAGANQVDGPGIVVSDQSALYTKALKAAVADARGKAEALASVSALHVGAVRSIEEQSQTPIPLRYDAARLAQGATPIEAGTQQITASVTVVFDAG